MLDLSHLDYWEATKNFFRSPIGFCTYPSYKVQHAGSTSPEGQGLTFQCNLFGHYILVRVRLGVP